MTEKGEGQRIIRPLFVALSVVVATLFVLSLSLVDGWLQSASTGLEPSLEGSLAKDQLETHRKYELYTQWTYQQNQRVYSWHAFSTKVIFWLSMFIAVSGVGFAFWQFVSASEEAREAASADELEIKTQLASLAFKSRSIAALVLFVSIAYMLIYTLWIYPIKETPSSTNTPISGSGTSSQPSASSQRSGFSEELLRRARNQPPKQGGE